MNAWEVIGGLTVVSVAGKTFINRWGVNPFTTRSTNTMSDPNNPTDVVTQVTNIINPPLTKSADAAIEAGAAAIDAAAAGVNPALGAAATLVTNAAKPAVEQFIATELPKVEAYIKAAALAGEHFIAHALQDAEQHFASFFRDHFAKHAASAVQKPAVTT